MTGMKAVVDRLSRWINRRSVLTASAAGLAVAATAGKAEASPLDVAKAIILAWRNLDVEGVLKHVSDDIVWYSHTGAKPPFIGKAAMREFVTALGAGIKNNRWRVFSTAVAGDTVYCEGVDDFQLLDGKQITVPYLGMMKVKNGLVVEWRDYFDNGLVERMKRGEVDFKTDPIAPLINRKALF